MQKLLNNLATDEQSIMEHNTHTHNTTVLLLVWNMSGSTRVSRYQKGKTKMEHNAVTKSVETLHQTNWTNRPQIWNMWGWLRDECIRWGSTFRLIWTVLPLP